MKSQLFVLSFHVLGFVMLMKGLFPYSSSTAKISDRSCFDAQGSTQRHIVLMLIDALRADYVFARTNSFRLRSVERLEKVGHARSIKLRCHTPTVTLPRLKALLTGAIPSFWDIIYNYNSTRLDLDNLLSQYKRKYPDNKIIFYGDDTWIRLFPNDFFYRSRGLQSFFVTDFDEIDRNVTEGLDFELEHYDEWNFLIVHYLGIDHIGHAHGAFNGFIERKLLEMDQVIERIVSRLDESDVLVITGDHGMADQGGHGGSSSAETLVPAVFVSRQFARVTSTDDEYAQIDLTATLSAFLEVAIPWNNLGVAIQSVLNTYYSDRPNLLKCLVDDNRRQLTNLLAERQVSTSSENLESLRDQAISLSKEPELSMLLLGLALFPISTAILWLDVPTEALFSLVGFALAYLIWGDASLALTAASLCFCLLVVLAHRPGHAVHKCRKGSRLLDAFLAHYPVLHLVSLFSTSFIEEEHQTWYYLLSTYLLIRTLTERSASTASMFVLSRLLRSWNQTGNKWLHLTDIGDLLNANEHRRYLFVVHLLSSAMFVRLLRESTRPSVAFILSTLVFVYRWDLLGRFSGSIPLVDYALLISLLVLDRLSVASALFGLSYLLCRTHNCLVVVVHMIFSRWIDESDARVLFLLSQTAYFHLGNSNSFVTIDIASGFVGIPVYLPAVHGTLVLLSTYGLSIVWMLKLTKSERLRWLAEVSFINCSFVFCIVAQRHHLFVWTVFAPKLFYLCTQTVLNLLIFSLTDSK